MRDLTQFRSLLPTCCSARPALGPVRFSLSDAPERERPTHATAIALAARCSRLDVDRLRDVPFHVDLTLQALPGLQMATGKLHGSRNRRTREMLADGRHRRRRPDREPQEVRTSVDRATGSSCWATVTPPWCRRRNPAASRIDRPGRSSPCAFPRRGSPRCVSGGQDSYMRRIPRDTQALRFLTNYVADRVGRSRRSPAASCSISSSAHIYDLMAVMVGATPDAARCGPGRRRARGAPAGDQAGHRRTISTQSDLSVAALADRHGCTPRFIQRLFEAEGHDVHRIRADAAARARPPPAERSAARRRQDQRGRL